ncbi:MAG: hypothetical protein JRJ87_15085 [Deltaproteobacteria bacterium]|nr:hypothetical protein [Deltaproteobacteria bacterium]
MDEIKLRKIRFSGLLDGWGLDQDGGLWRTQNGGKIFTAIALPDHSGVADLAVDQKILWLVSHNRFLYRSNRQGELFLRSRLPAQAAALSVNNDNTVVILGANQGDVYYSKDGGQNWHRSLPMQGSATAIALSPTGSLIVSGCQGKLAHSNDGGHNYIELEARERTASTDLDCLRVAGFLEDGRFVLLGNAGKIMIGDRTSEKFEVAGIKTAANFSDVSVLGKGLMLVGDHGTRVHARLTQSSRLSLTKLGGNGSGITDIDIPSRNVYWVAHHNGDLTLSLDGGLKWATVETPDKKSIRISFVERRRGFILSGHHIIYGTQNSGKTWQKLGYWPDIHLIDIFFINRLRGWIVGNNGCVIRTTDGGKTWTINRLPTTLTLNKVLFVDSQRGWAVGEKQAVYKTTDGGRNWSAKLTGRGNLYSAQFEKTGKGWVAGEHGVILYTPDAGESWTPRQVPTSKTVKVLAFIDQQRGLAAGQDGELFITKDGGQNWKRLFQYTRTSFTAAACQRKNARCLLGSDRDQLFEGNPFKYVR